MQNMEYIDTVMARAVFRMLGDGSVFGEIPGVTGVWANEASLERCQRVLRRVLMEWLYLKRQHNEEIPFHLEGITLP